MMKILTKGVLKRKMRMDVCIYSDITAGRPGVGRVHQMLPAGIYCSMVYQKVREGTSFQSNYKGKWLTFLE